ncbi:leucine-rich repeat-containing protein 75A-like [Tachysurus vachellii]|uniref:leucine-rich repeat-containing protein 75A-like n=1 Tax=Tachysurus vachellii TaxID=175792 RepID=UPI00296B5408|nr:leucine-rich repeat-containing protein 75A-like [Tachysurus vachellii]
MGARQSKGPEAGPGPLLGVWRRAQGSLLLRSSERPENPGVPAPYHRRVGMIQDMLLKAKEGRQEEASELLKSLRQDLGMESTSLDDVLYRYASFRNMVDPITHDLIISLARYVQCTKTEGESLSAMEKVCRQLTYHLSPHPRWRRQGLLKGKPQASLKAVLSVSPDGTVDLSGLPLSRRDAERLVIHLQRNSARVRCVELGFTELTDDMLLMLLPTLSSLPALESLSLNGNRLTRGVLRQLTDTLKEPRSFPALAWVDLGNNVDIFSLPQAFLLSLRKRCPKQGNLPTIQEQPEQGGGAGGGACGTVGLEEVGEDSD